MADYCLFTEVADEIAGLQLKTVEDWGVRKDKWDLYIKTRAEGK